MNTIVLLASLAKYIILEQGSGTRGAVTHFPQVREESDKKNHSTCERSGLYSTRSTPQQFWADEPASGSSIDFVPLCPK